MPKLNKKFIFHLVFFIVNVFCISVQCCGKDTLQLSKEEFLNIVKQFHPLLKTLEIQNKIANENISRARGNFDPILAGKLGQKTIDENVYYNQQGAELVIPTWYGIDFNTYYNNITGNKINEETTKGTMYQVGIQIPLLKNLLYDKRRATLEQAKINLKMTNAEQILYRNNFLMEAEILYWQWLQSYKSVLLQNEIVQRNKERLSFNEKSVAFGERAAIDTVEIMAQLQMFQLQQQEAELQFIRLTQELKLYLWKSNNEPYELKNDLIPNDDFVEFEKMNYYGILAKLNNEAERRQFQGLQYYNFKNKFYETELRLKRQEILPKLDFSYQFFNRNLQQLENLPLFNNNFQYGISFNMPIFLRQSRADINISKLKIEQNKLDFAMKENELLVKVNNLNNELENYMAQLTLSQKNVENYSRLLRAEEARFEMGESSFFMVNLRETKVVETNLKIVQLQAKINMTFSKIKWLEASF